MQEIRDYTKEKVGALTPLDYFYKEGKIYWNCRCDCGNIVQRYSVLLGQSLRLKSFSTCGCISRMIEGKVRTIVGCEFDKLKILSYDLKNKKYLCKEKGKEIELLPIQVVRKLVWYFKNYEKYIERDNMIKELGCSSMEDYNKKSIRLHHLLFLIKSRCYDKKCWAYPYYGERGIKVCQEWLENSKSFIRWSLLNGYKEDLQIDRINNDGDYSPNNCRWVTQLENANNKRNNSYIEHNGQIKSLSQWCRELNLDYKYTHYKVKYKGFTIQQVIDYIKNKESGS